MLHSQKSVGTNRINSCINKASILVSKAQVRMAVKTSKECQSIDPHLVWRLTERLEVEDVWQQLGMDITHYDGRHYLTLIKCGSTRRVSNSVNFFVPHQCKCKNLTAKINAPDAPAESSSEEEAEPVPLQRGSYICPAVCVITRSGGVQQE